MYRYTRQAKKTPQKSPLAECALVGRSRHSEMYMRARDTTARVVCTRRDDPGGEASPRGPCSGTMSRRDGANDSLFVEKPGPVLMLCHSRAPIVPKLGTHSYGQKPISNELNAKDSARQKTGSRYAWPIRSALDPARRGALPHRRLAV